MSRLMYYEREDFRTVNNIDFDTLEQARKYALKLVKKYPYLKYIPFESRYGCGCEELTLDD